MIDEKASTRPAFTKAAMPEEPAIRDKDNADRTFAPRFAPGAANLAPRGAVGTKHDLPTPERDTADSPQSLKRTFQSIVRGHDKDRGIDR